MIGLASVTLSMGVWAGSSTDMVTDPITDFVEATTRTVNMSSDDWKMDKNDRG